MQEVAIMNNYTVDDIFEKLNNRIDYNEIARVLELDLNNIADTTWQEGDDILEFKAFFDFAEFDTFVNLQAPGEGQPQLITPVLISLLDGQFSEPKGPQLFNVLFRIEAFAFAKDKDRIRQIFEVYNKLNQGAILTGMFGSSLVTSFTEFPVMTPPEPYKGMDRMSVFMLWNLSFIYTGQLSNDVKLRVDNEQLDFTIVSLARHRTTDTVQRNNEDETISIPTNQNISISVSTIYDGSEVSKKILRNIKNLGFGLTETFEVEIEYPEIEDTDTYKTVLTEGTIDITQGSVLNMTFAMSITDIVEEPVEPVDPIDPVDPDPVDPIDPEPTVPLIAPILSDQTIVHYSSAIPAFPLASPISSQTIPYITDVAPTEPLQPPIIDQTIPFPWEKIWTIPYYTVPYTELTEEPVISQTIPYIEV